MKNNYKRELKLNTSKNWNLWFSIIKIKTHDQNVWNLINSFSIIKSLNQLIKFLKIDLKAQSNANFTKKHARYKIKLSKYKQQYKKYEKQKKDLTKITNFILIIINVINVTYIQKMKVHFWNQLIIFKTRFAFINVAQNFEFKQQYHCFVKKFSNRQNVDQWLDNYIKMYIFDVKTKITECINDKRVYRDFLLKIEKLTFIFVEMR